MSEDKKLPEICGAPGCGGWITDKDEFCPDCYGRGYNQSLNSKQIKEPWTDIQWAKWRDAEEHKT